MRSIWEASRFGAMSFMHRLQQEEEMGGSHPVCPSITAAVCYMTVNYIYFMEKELDRALL